MACIRTCNLQYLTSECLQDPECACLDLYTLRLVRTCIEATCPVTNLVTFEEAVLEACGVDVVNRVIPPKSAAASIPRATPPKVPSPPPSTVLPSSTFITTTRAPATPSVTPRPTFFPESGTRLPGTSLTSELLTGGQEQTTDTVDESSKGLLQTTTITSKGNDPSGTNTQTADAFGGALESREGGKDTATPVAASVSQSLLTGSLTGTQEGPTVAGDGLQGTGGADTQTSPLLGSAPAPTSGPEGARQQNKSSPNKTFIIGGVISGVIAAVVLLGLVFLCVRRRRKRLELDQGRVTRSTVQSLDPQTHEGWSRFNAPSPTQEKHELQKKHELSAEQVLEKVKSKNTADISNALVAMMAAGASNLSDETNQKLHSYFQDVMPPPSMRSKRYSKATTHTFQSESEHASTSGFETFHSLDSQTQLSYPIERSPSSASAFSSGTAPPTHLFGTLRDPARLLFPAAPREVATLVPVDLDFGSAEHSRQSSAYSIPPFSQTSTMASINLGPNVGRAL